MKDNTPSPRQSRLYLAAAVSVVIVVFAVVSIQLRSARQSREPALEPISDEMWAEIEYGKELFVHTARHLGLKGKAAGQMQTRMNCQNCHLDGGAKPFGISLETVHARYPDYRAREGRVLTVVDRINACVQRPMNGTPLAPDGREMRALLAYFRWLARGVPVGGRKHGDRINDAVLLPTRAADPDKGKLVFETHCVSCHGQDGQGKLAADGVEYEFPPLWGPESYNEASSMFRIVKAAAFIKANMPLGATWDKPVLSDEEAFDVAAFINDISRNPRPRSRWNDFPTVQQKPVDHPYGPYADPFSEKDHKFGPFGPIIRYLKEHSLPVFY